MKREHATAKTTRDLSECFMVGEEVNFPGNQKEMEKVNKVLGILLSESLTKYF